MTIFTKAILLIGTAAMLAGTALSASAAEGANQKISTDAAQAASSDEIKSKILALRLPLEDKIEFRGAINLDRAGVNGGSMMYPAPNVGGFLAALLTHAVLIESSKSRQKTKLQEEADKLLVPYREVLDSFYYKELAQRSATKLTTGVNLKPIGNAEQGTEYWVIEVAPVFVLTRDESALVLENSIVIIPPGSTPSDKNLITIKVVSTPKNEPNLPNFWVAEQGIKIRDESAYLFAQSLDIALNNLSTASTDASNSFKTVRYLEGGEEKMERAQIISDRCGRLVIKNLRGHFMSVPVKQSASADEKPGECNSSLAMSKP